MASRTELYQITRELRRYLEWQLQGGAPGVLPAPIAEREAWQRAESAREVERARVMREELFGAPAAKPVKTAPQVERGEPAPAKAKGSRLDAISGPDKSRGPSAPTPSPSPSGGGGGLWNDFGSRPRRTFHAVEEKSAPASNTPVNDAPAAPRPPAAQPQQPVKQPVKQQVSVAQDPPSDMGPADDFGGYDESYDESYIDYSEFELSEPPVAVEQEVEKPVRRVEMTNAEKLDFLKNYLGDCHRCALHQGRTQVVFGDGNPKARLMFIGEGPGKEEDRQGVPFVGVAGDLLNQMIAAMGFQREDVYVASVVKCRSAENRNPAAGEVRECSPFLLKQIEAVQPEVIVALGGLAAQTLLGDSSNFTQLRGRWHAWKEIPVMPTYNPNSLLRNERLKRDAWNDLQLVMARLGEKK